MIVAMDPVAQAPARWVGRDRDRPHDLANLATTAEQEVPTGHPATDAGGIAVELEGPGLIAGRSVQATGASAATMSRRFTRQGVPSMISRQPSHRRATLSRTIVRIWTPMISIEPMVAGASDPTPGRRVDHEAPPRDGQRGGRPASCSAAVCATGSSGGMPVPDLATAVSRRRSEASSRPVRRGQPTGFNQSRSAGWPSAGWWTIKAYRLACPPPDLPFSSRTARNDRRHPAARPLLERQQEYPQGDSNP